jgi:hypothetical protein
LIQPVSKPKTGGRPQGPGKTKPLYRGAKGEGRSEKENPVPSHFHPIAPAHFSLRDDGTIGAVGTRSTASETKGEKVGDDVEIVPTSSAAPRLLYQSDAPFVRLYHGNSLELLGAIAAKYPEGRFDWIFADPQLR